MVLHQCLSLCKHCTWKRHSAPPGTVSGSWWERWPLDLGTVGVPRPILIGDSKVNDTARDRSTQNRTPWRTRGAILGPRPFAGFTVQAVSSISVLFKIRTKGLIFQAGRGTEVLQNWKRHAPPRTDAGPRQPRFRVCVWAHCRRGGSAACGAGQERAPCGPQTLGADVCVALGWTLIYSIVQLIIDLGTQIHNTMVVPEKTFVVPPDVSSKGLLLPSVWPQPPAGTGGSVKGD